MNQDSFENELRTLQRRPLPAEWRDEMLLAAAQKPRAARAPRWLLAGWGGAWAAILVMYCTTPTEPVAPHGGGMSDTAPPLLWEQRAAVIEALLAAN